MFATDLDGDGDADVIGVDPWAIGATTVKLLRNDGSGRFRDAPAAWLERTAGSAVSLGDVDGDGHADLAIGGQGVMVQLFLRHRSGGFWRINPARLPAGVQGALGDFDGDGTVDLLGKVLDGGVGWVPSVARNPGHGYLASFLAEGAGPVAAGDLDGDGDLDAALLGIGAFGTYRNDGRGNFAPWQSGAATGTSLSAIDLIDLDADGDVDLLAPAPTRWQPGSTTAPAGGPCAGSCSRGSGAVAWSTSTGTDGRRSSPGTASSPPRVMAASRMLRTA